MSDIGSELGLEDEYVDFQSDAEGSQPEDDAASDAGSVKTSSTTANDRSASAAKVAVETAVSFKHTEKEKELKEIKNKPGPLHLLKLPVDVLRLVVNELTHTNDLNAAALSCSTLHILAVELIYSRFDIVWPDDEAEPDETRTGVDALTYGLSTLALGEETFQAACTPSNPLPYASACPKCGFANGTKATNDRDESSAYTMTLHRVGNSYAQYIRKLSIGNGPPQFIRDYTADKEAGKMLNTLVAIAIGRCKNLENFVWDMPTGLTRDVWLALASLANRKDSKSCRLRRVWIRLHDRRLATYEPFVRATGTPPSNAPSPLPTGGNNVHVSVAPYPPYPGSPPSPEMQSRDQPTNIKNVSFPSRTFSLLPPLESLSVMEIDAPQHIYEMSVLVNKSAECLKHLRISIAEFLYTRSRDWKEVWEGEDAPDPYEAFKSSINDSQKRAGGILGTLVGRFFSVKEYERALAFVQESHASSDTSGVEQRLSNLNSELQTVSVVAKWSNTTNEKTPTEFDIVSRKLALESLEVNFFPLSVNVLAGAVDWSKLTTLTLLSCPLSDNLWLYLRRAYTPRPPQGNLANVQLKYALSLRRIRTDTVSPVFIKFLAETLAPNSIQTLLLKERHPSPKRRPARASLKQLYHSVIRRHGKSLHKLSVDSAPRKRNGFLDSKEDTSYYQQWLAYRDVLWYITSSNMSRLRELCISMQYKDWHYFLQRLVHIPRLEILYVPVLHHEGQLQNCRKSDPEDLANQVATAISLRPEIGLAYFANQNRCYELYETKASSSVDDAGHSPGEWMQGTQSEASDDDEGDGDGDEDGGDESNDDTSTDGGTDESDDDSPSAADAWVGDGVEDKGKIEYQVKEILFPDEKAEIFKTRRLEL